MTPERWQRLKQLFGAALECALGEREAMLAGACEGDPELLAEVRKLLASHEGGGEFLDEPVPDPGPSAPERIGPYRLLREVGHGGMGTVYLAERVDDEYRRQVAIKLVRLGMDSAFVLARFRTERQILASLQHSGIAALLDGGTTSAGRPYFVMENVQGEPIDRYCDERHLPVAERLRLFLLVCAAVEHAHGRLVVHRDIKPGNILVTAEGQPKLLDFGLAKLLDPGAQGDDQTTTQYRFVTPAFASPEQLVGGPITTASDVYSLGALLYLLLTGWRAYGDSRSSYGELAREAREQPPRKPSAVVTERDPTTDDPAHLPEARSALRGSTPEKLRRTLAGDLDAIVLKAMRKDPADRYRSVERLSEDVRRFLDGLPVGARRGGGWYRLRKFATRHALALAATGLVLVALTVAFAETVRARGRAERRAEDVRRLAGSVVVELNNTIARIPGTTQARAEVVKRAQEYLNVLARESRNDLILKRDLAAAYEQLCRVQGLDDPASLGDLKGALASAGAAVALYEEVLRANRGDAESSINLARALTLLSHAKASAGRADGLEDARRAVALAERALARSPTIELRRTLARCLSNLGQAYDAAGDFGQGLDCYRRGADAVQAIPVAERSLKDELSLMINFTNLALSMARDDPGGAEALYRRSLAIGEPLLAKHPNDVEVRTRVAQVRQRLGLALAERGQLTAAEEQFTKALVALQENVTADPGNASARTQVALTQVGLGVSLADGPEPQRALDSLLAARAALAALSAADPESARKSYWLGFSEAALGRAEIAIARRSPPAAAAAHWRRARSWSAEAVELLEALEAHGKFLPEMADLRPARDQVATCDAALASP